MSSSGSAASTCALAAERVGSSGDFPLTVGSAGSDRFVRPLGSTPSARLVARWGEGLDAPAGFRWAAGTHAVEAVAVTEAYIDVDQTNRSVVVGGRVVVKWVTTPLVGPHPAPERLRRLVGAHFRDMPEVWFGLEWQTPDGDWVPVVTATSLVEGATDGWTWCLDEARHALGVLAGEATPFAGRLGDVTAAMHVALADSPTGPVATHGDFHVGQVLRDTNARLFVIDFDGNPTLSPDERVEHRPAAYDVAGMLVSLENVGHVVRHHHPEVSEDAVIAWTEAVQEEFLATYRDRAGDLLDESLLDPYADDQIQRELDYADAYLPRWRYVPEAALRRRGRR
jgi:maltokinase